MAELRKRIMEELHRETGEEIQTVIENSRFQNLKLTTSRMHFLDQIEASKHSISTENGVLTIARPLDSDRRR